MRLRNLPTLMLLKINISPHPFQEISPVVEMTVEVVCVWQSALIGKSLLASGPATQGAPAANLKLFLACQSALAFILAAIT
ncbi:hypothetical protein [Parafilimonas sp.]|uniref:hypothetical protein n=1 Tax=Parafilimonas sp. TaxID=1969739 RepID=UPI003F7ED392